jgi:membrane protein
MPFMRSIAEPNGGFRSVGAALFSWVRALIRAVRVEGLDYRATSLAYTTLLSIVPGLALCFSLLKTFGVNKQLEPFLQQVLSPLGDKAPILADKILDFVARVNIGVLSFMGLVALIYIVISMLSKIETAFNHIWRITQPRSLMRRAGDYISVALLGPVLMFSAMGVTTSLPGASAVRRLVAYEPFGILFFLAGKLLSLVLIVAAFSFVYLYIPNTRVPWRAALFGGTVGGLGWKLAGFLFAHFVSGSANYHALYSSLVIVVLFMIWLDLSWLILLMGGQAAMYFQHPYYVKGFDRFRDLGNRMREGLGLTLMALIADRFIRNEMPWTLDALAEHLLLPWETVKEALEVLQRGGLLVETASGDESFLPARDIAGIQVKDILGVLRTGRDDAALMQAGPTFMVPAVEKALEMLEYDAAASTVAHLSLRDLVLTAG